jgi:glyoxylase-like metal-dependent hydrolase (beta-lactamase superfamily II)
MKARRFGRIHQLTLFWPVFPISCYLVEEKDGLTLIDTGLEQAVKGIVKYAHGLNRPIVRIALTHPHGDHAGGLDGVKAAFPSAEVSISRRDARLLSGDMSSDEHESKLPIKGGFIPTTTQPDRLLEDADKVGSLVAVSCPGHTPGSMFFYDEQEKAAVVGDVLQTAGGLTIAGRPNRLFPWLYRATWDCDAATSNAARLLDFDLDYVMCAHGPVLQYPLPKLRRAIADSAQ